MLIEAVAAAAAKSPLATTNVDLAPFGGVTWTAIFMALANLLIGGVFVAIVKSRPALKKIAADREANLLEERAREMMGMRRRIAQLEAEQRVDRHSIANLEHCLNYLLDALELTPSKAPQIAARMRAMRAEQRLQQATEKSGIYAQAIKDAAQEDEP
jgi:hypothetical protein